MSSTELKGDLVTVGAPTDADNHEASVVGETYTHEVFKKTADGVDFRTVGWKRTAVIFMKLQFALGVLNIPSAIYVLGAVGGAFNVVGWGLLNTYGGYVLGNFRKRHPECHGIADMAFLCGGPIAREAVEVLFVFTYVLSAGASILGVTIALNALSDHAACTVWWSFLSTIVVIAAASIRKFEKIGWITWVGFASIFTAVFIVVIGVTTIDRPAAAPQTGPYDLGYHAIAHPDFVNGIVAVVIIFVSSSATSAMVPVISEMKNPAHYNRALFTAQGTINSSYLTFGLVVYAYCGKWVASPSLGSAGPTVKKVAYGVGLIGLVVSGLLWLHVPAKIVFVRILRNSKHLQANTMVHWCTWFGCTISLGIIAFLLAEAIPVFYSIVALSGAICFAPMAICLPAWFWLHDHAEYRSNTVGRKAIYYLHCFILLLGTFLTVGGTYGTVQQVVDEYANGSIGSVFSCADNSGST
ncbi:hypothetical protein LTR47_007872 [Exophiala xenobiotica]|nr:hypothetical protein LTR47_007872 [Exophiala xenobiotica]KAK5248042.1 hypothetical protein LTS06_006910 [Exophiala xenobiotica]KAK5352652.1 hypothetical protein LTR61_003778 [Exophiala xenobiotica]KAK5375515.1 hypothetical protein LTR11_005065 [Exophiala xenobiotica]KAK5391237.1 hypothetical protein LTS03_000610 [Exophiala xenobiotica]